jgi:dTDP-4-dehydrorhamnose 3,5-epimerase
VKFTPLAVPGAFRVELEPKRDDRGYFARWWCEDEFMAQGIHFEAVQANTGFSPLAGTLRGLHFQSAPEAEAKYVRCTRGAAFDVVVDLRPDSPTFRRWDGVRISEDDGAGVFVPTGCAHGYLTLEPETEVHYLTSARFAPALAGGIRYDDPLVGIRWPNAPILVSERDRTWPLLTP